MIDVVIAGVGQAPVGEHWDLSLRELALQAIEAARADAAGLQPQALIAANILAQAVMPVAAGAAEVVLVVGIEKMTDQIASQVETAVAASIDSDFEAVQGMTPTAQAAILMRRYMHEHRVD